MLFLTNNNKPTGFKGLSLFRLARGNIKELLMSCMFFLLAFTGVNAQISPAAPSCNLVGPLKSCLYGGNLEITAVIEFSTATPTLNYSFPINQTGAFIVSMDPFVYDSLTNSGTQKLVINPGTITGQINLQLNVTTDYGVCECSKSITIVDVTVASSFTPIKCFNGTSTLTATATGFGSASYTFTLTPGGTVIGPQVSNVANFTGLYKNFYTVTVKDNNGCTAQTTKDITEPLYNPVSLNCPDDMTLPACASQSEVTDAFTSWLASFNYSGGTNPKLTITPTSPTAPPVCGGSTTVTWSVTSECEPFISECSRTFTVGTAPDLTVNCSVDPNLPACTDGSAIQTAYDAWVAGFTHSGGCNVIDNIGDVPALGNLTCGGQLTFTYKADNGPAGCQDHAECTSTFTVGTAADLTVNCSPDPLLDACTDASAIQAAYDAWVAGFTYNGGCNVTDNIGMVPALGNLTCGGQLTFTYMADNGPLGCQDHAECTSTFTVGTAADLTVNCSPDPNLPACTDGSAIQTAYDAWVAGFTHSGGCNVIDNIGDVPSLGNLTCGGQLTFTYKADNGPAGCQDHAECTSTFTVGTATDLKVNCSPDPELPSCSDASAIQTAYDAWVAGFTYNGGCNVTDNIGMVPPLGNLTCGGQLIFTYMADNGKYGCQDHAECTSTFTVQNAPDLMVNCPTDPNLPACTDSSAIRTAYDAWVAGFTYNGGCNVIDNKASIPALGDLTCGGELTFTYKVDNGPLGCQDHDECTSTFTVQMAQDLTVNCSPDPNLPACTGTKAIMIAYSNWVDGFTHNGGCNVTDNIASIPALGDLTCGGQLSFTYKADNGPLGCQDHAECTSTFTVGTAPDLTIKCSPDPVLSACTDTATIRSAYDLWVAGFTHSGGCDVIDNIASIPALGDLTCGGQLSFTYMADNGPMGCQDHAECTSTFTVGTAADLTVNCSPDPQLPPCTDASAIQTAYNTWVAGFTYSGGCNVVDNKASIPALGDLTCGGQLSFTYKADNGPLGCQDHAECTSTFTVGAAADLTVNCSPDPQLPPCTDASAIQTAYNTWVAGFTYSGGCNVVDNKASIPALGDLTCGGQLSFTYMADNGPLGCQDHAECTSTFTVGAAADLTVNCSPDPQLPPCTDASAIQTAYNTWVAGFTHNGGCNVTDNIASIPALGDLTCGGQLSFTYMADNGPMGCQDHAECTSTFTVGTAADLTVNCSPDPQLPPCTDASAIQTAYNAWVAGFTHNGGCNVTDNIASIPALGDLTCGGQLSFTYMADNGPMGCQDHAECTSTFTVGTATDLTVNCPTDPNLPSCTDTTAIRSAYAAWVAGFTYSGGCNVVDNKASVPALGDLSCGGQLSFTYMADNGPLGCQDHAECTSTFTVQNAAELKVNCSPDPNLAPCTDTAAIRAAYTAWVAGFTHSGGCNVIDNIASIPALGDLSCGGQLNFTYKADNGENVCKAHAECPSTFTVQQAPKVLLTCPKDVIYPGGQPQDSVTAAYNAWLASAVFSGGCNPKLSNNSTQVPGPCNQSVTITWTVKSSCEPDATCSATFTVQQCVRLGNFVWYDKNNNGIQDSGEQGINGVTVNLYADSNGDNTPDGSTPIATTTTAAGSGPFTGINGIYLFPGLAEGKYIVGVINPTGYAVSATTATSGNPDNNNNNDNNGVNIAGNEVRSNFITLTTNGEPDAAVDGDGNSFNSTLDFGFKLGSIGDFVWSDLNGDGIQNAGEPGIPGVTVELYTSSSPLTFLTSTVTNGNGNYLFPDLPAGDYCVKFISSLVPSPANVGNDSTDSDPQGYDFACLLLSPGENNLTIDAGFKIPPPPVICYESCDDKPGVGAQQTITDNGSTVTIRTTFAKSFVDNTYGTNAIGWPSGHTFGNLTGSDHLQLALYDANKVKVMEFKIDYISAGTAPSGYKTLSVNGGDGSMILGSASDVVSALTSMDVNLNNNGSSYYLFTNSPATDATYTPNPTYPNWIYDVWYEVTVKKSAFGAAGFGSPLITSVHASPSKTGNNTECVQICKLLSVDAVGSDGPCATTCKGTIDVTAAHGTAPYSFSWSDGSSTLEDRSALCAGTYTVTVTDAVGATASTTVVLSDPPASCPPVICYESCTDNPAVGAQQTVTDNGTTVTIRTTFAKSFVDNTYGTTAIGWPGGHTFGNLTGSDHLQLALYDANKVKKMEFKIDYISAGTAPSGYKTLSVNGGDGAMILGSAGDVVSAMTSMDVNLNNNGTSYYLFTNSPATNTSYTPNPTYPNWIYDVWYEVTVKKSAFGAAGFGSPLITSVHASPSKTGNNTECVQLCLPLSVTAVGSNGPCATTCKGTIDVTPAHGTAPFSYVWSDGLSTSEDRSNLCAGTYTVTVTDAAGATASTTVVISNPPASCPPSICYESCTDNPAVGAQQTVTDNGSTVTIRTTFAKSFVDNTYGTTAIGWPGGHTFGNLTGSDHLQLALYDANKVKKMEFKIDYISAGTAPSGYKTLSVNGGDGGMILGSAGDVVSAMTSMDVNLNNNGSSYYLFTNSPATNASYTPNPTYPNWIYDVWYEVTVKKSAFGAAGFGSPLITSVHASPSKTGNNTECVQLCLPLSVKAVGSDGPCGTSCQGSISVTPAHGTAPFSFVWSDGPSTSKDRSNLCAGSYTVTVTDASGATASTTVVIKTPVACPAQFCFASPQKPDVVFSKSMVTYNPDNTVTIRTTLAKTFVDNTYGKNSIGWPGRGDHKFSDLTGKQKLQMALYDGLGQKKMEFKLDYLSAFAGAPSGYKSQGVTGGQGGMILGSSSDVTSVMTSLDMNLNTYGYVLTTNSPATNSSYAPNPTYPNWIYDVWFEVTVKQSAFGPNKFGSLGISKLQADPSKTGKNDESVSSVNCSTLPLKKQALVIGNNAEGTKQISSAIEDPELTMHPNPASGNLTVAFKPAVTGNSTIVLYDIKGRVVMNLFKGQTEKGKLYQFVVESSKLAQSIYMVQLSNGGKLVNQKLVVER